MDLNPDALRQLIHELYEIETGTEVWNNLKLAKLMTKLMLLYSRNIDSMLTTRFVIDEQFKFTFKYFFGMFMTYLISFFIPLICFFLCKDT